MTKLSRTLALAAVLTAAGPALGGEADKATYWRATELFGNKIDGPAIQMTSTGSQALGASGCGAFALKWKGSALEPPLVHSLSGDAASGCSGDVLRKAWGYLSFGLKRARTVSQEGKHLSLLDAKGRAIAIFRQDRSLRARRGSH